MEKQSPGSDNLAAKQKTRCSIRLGDEDFEKINHFKGDPKNGFKQIPKTIIIWPKTEDEYNAIISKVKASDYMVIPKLLLKDIDSVSKVIKFGITFASLGTRKAFWGGQGRPDIEAELKSYGILIKEE
jgi:hypothetical protein